MAQHEGVKYNDEGIPVLELPEAIPVRLPKYTYETYERELRPFKAEWDALDKKIEEDKETVESLNTQIKEARADKDLSKNEAKETIDSLKLEIDDLKKSIVERFEKSLALKVDWREKQRRRWVDGHMGIPGLHYFYLTQLKIKHKGALIRPLWRDVDEMAILDYLDCVENERDNYVFKRRGFGLSTIFGGLIPIYIFVTQPGSTCLMTSADLGRVGDLRVNKFFAMIDSMDSWIGVKRTKNNEAKGIFEISHYDDRGDIKHGITSVMICAQTSQDKADVGKFEGTRAAYVFLDELFLHPYPVEVRIQTKSCVMDDFSRWGIMVSGGSAGLGNRLGMRQGKNIWDNGDSDFSYKRTFIPGSVGISSVTLKDDKGNKIGVENFCINGWSDEGRADAFIRWQRAVYDLSPDKQNLIGFTKQYPLKIDEVFVSDEIGVIPEDIAKLIPAQELDHKNHPRNIRRIQITVGDNDEAYFVNDPKGAWMIVEEPVKGRTYEMGTDTAPSLMTKDETTMDPDSTERSMNCAVIKCVETDTYVAIYLKRTSDEKVIYKEISAGQKLYNDCKNMIERNRSDVLYVQYKWADNLNALAFQPKWIGSKGWKPKTIRGVYKASNEEKILTAMFGYFRENISKIEFPIILSQLKGFGLENADVIDAIAMCEVISKGREVSDGARAKTAMQMKYRMVPFTVIRGGRSVVEYRKVLTEDSKQILNGGQGMNWEAMSR